MRVLWAHSEASPRQAPRLLVLVASVAAAVVEVLLSREPNQGLRRGLCSRLSSLWLALRLPPAGHCQHGGGAMGPPLLQAGVVWLCRAAKAVALPRKLSRSLSLCEL